MLRIKVRPADPMPIYAQIMHQIRLAILSGELTPGQQLPTVRQLGVDLAVNTNTVTRAYAELHRAGLIETRQGVGTFVQGITRKPASADRRERLAGVAETAIAEAAAIGFGPDDLIEMVQSIAIGEN